MRTIDGVRPVHAATVSGRRSPRAFVELRAGSVKNNKSFRVAILAAAAVCFSGGMLARATPRPGAWTENGRTGNSVTHRNSQPYQRQHLPEWFRQHQNLPPQAQERALRSEPGFERLPPQKQQRLFRRLRQLDAMAPRRRERTLERMEALEKLSPEQRQQVRKAMQQVTQMPEQRRQMMHRAFRDLSQVPPAQRQAMLNSVEFKQRFSGQERQLLGTLIVIQPYIPEQPSAAPVDGLR